MLPFFVLNIVVYPGEDMNLHVFEPRYRQLVGDCLASGGSFGIPILLRNKVQEYGAEVTITELVNHYPDGRMDIRIRGTHVLKVNSFVNPVPGKMHAGGNVTRLESDSSAGIVQRLQCVAALEELYSIMKVEVPVDAATPYLSYSIAHKIGLSIEQEYELLGILEESERLAYLINHLKKAIPVVREIERTKEIIKMNGHFRNFDTLEF